MDDVIKIHKPIKDFEDLFILVVENKGSDLHLQAGSPPIIRIAGIPKRVDTEPISQQKIEFWAQQILPPKKLHILLENHDIDFAYNSPHHGRMRVNFFYQRGNMGLAARLVRTDISTIHDLHLPEILHKIASFNDGLVIVAGITGSGKSTTLASMIEYINQNESYHIITIEDPIEYLYTNKKAFINQREVGIDTPSFKDSLKYAVRQDPDIILVGEMRDAETMLFALSAAETGHLVFATLHSSNAPQTVSRILDLFPPDQHFQIRQSIQFNLRAVINQKLLPSIKEGVQRVPAVEVMIVDGTVRELIRKAEDIKMNNAIRAGASVGMQDFNKSLLELVQNNFISEEIAFRVSPNPETLKLNLKGIYLDDEKAIF